MPFPFTFSLTVPGISNPFSGHGQTAQSPEPDPSQVQNDRPSHCSRPPSVSSSVSPISPLSTKRGWEPSISGPSLAATSSTSSSGYLDTPAKYRDIASQPDHDCGRREIEDMAAGEPSSMLVHRDVACTAIHRPRAFVVFIFTDLINILSSLFFCLYLLPPHSLP